MDVEKLGPVIARFIFQYTRGSVPESMSPKELIASVEKALSDVASGAASPDEVNAVYRAVVDTVHSLVPLRRGHRVAVGAGEGRCTVLAVIEESPTGNRVLAEEALPLDKGLRGIAEAVVKLAWQYLSLLPGGTSLATSAQKLPS